MNLFIDIWAAGALVSGLGYICWVTYKQWLVSRSQSWPAVNGQIVRSEMARKDSQVGPDRTPNRTFSARIEYRYMVGSRVYKGDTICIGGELNTSFRQRAQRRLDSYPEGSSVIVYYNPNDPAVCCLERRGETALFGYLAGGAISLFGLLVLLEIVSFGR